MDSFNYYVLTYHMKKGGVTSVIENIITSAKNTKITLIESGEQENYFAPKNVKHIKIPELNYSNEKFKSLKKLEAKAKIIAEKIGKEMDFSKKCILHTHNLNLFKNAYLTTAIKILAEKYPKNIIVLMQVHDFAEENRKEQLNLLLNCTGKKSQKIAGRLAFTQAKNIFYLTINSRDKKILEKTGIPKQKVFVFPNAINTKLQNPLKNKQLLERINEYAKKNSYFFSMKRKNIVYPVRMMRRKNIAEAILILKVLNSLKNNFQLLITLNANSPKDIEYSEKIKKFVKQERLPVVIGFGQEFIGEKRKIKNKKIETFILSDLFYHSNTIITTSIMEGFGFTFIIGWSGGKEVVGRRINFLMKDFENNDLKFPGFYNNLLIEGKEFSKISLENQLEIIKSKKFDKVIFKQLENTFNAIIHPDKKIIKINKKIIEKKYSLKNYYKSILTIVQNVEKIKIKNPQINNQFLIDFFSSKEQKIIITDLDGTLLNNKNYSLGQLTKNTYKKVQKNKIPICFCTSKSFHELQYFRKNLRNNEPFIAENGSAIYIPKKYFKFNLSEVKKSFKEIKNIKKINKFYVLELNVPHTKTLSALKKIQNKLLFETKIYSQMSANELMKITNLPKDLAELSKTKYYADGFFVPKLNIKKFLTIKKEAKKMGFEAIMGGRFVGLNKGSDKGLATKILLYLFEKKYYKIYSISLGDSENDLPMFKNTDKSFLIKRSGKQINKQKLKNINNLEIIDEIAPKAWAIAIKKELNF